LISAAIFVTRCRKTIVCISESQEITSEIRISTSDATLDVITSNLMFSTHHLMFDVFADKSDVKQSGCSLQTIVSS